MRPGTIRGSCTSRSKACCRWTLLQSRYLSTPRSSFQAANIRSGASAVRDELLLYYERELNYLRQLGAEFAEKYPKIASRLVLDTEKETADPHVERLLEGFAFLAARVHLKIDDEFPEITE